MIDSDQIGALGLDVQWQEPWDPKHCITTHPKSVFMLPHLLTSAFRPLLAGSTAPSCLIVFAKEQVLAMANSVAIHVLAKA